MDHFTQQDAALVEAASVAAESTSSASAAACIATTRAGWDVQDGNAALASRAAVDAQRVLDTIKIAMSLMAPPPRTRT